MQLLDYLVLGGYFVVMAGIGLWMMRFVKAQEDYFMGGRSFGKILQTFAAFGAGTGSSDPVNTGRTTFTSGMSGMWSVMYWLFVTPFYWITGTWYRRMRHLTLGDWFAERYESRRLGAAYAVFGIVFYIYYGSMLFSAIGKVAAPLVGTGTINLGGRPVGIEYVLVPVIGVIVLVYGVLGGLRAAYVTDLIQGLCIILLSVLLIPYGMRAIVERFGDPANPSMGQAFQLLHQQLPDEYFQVVGSSRSSEFPLYRIVVVVIINLLGVVIQPHFIATGGGSAKTEMTARVGLVVGNFLKRLCTVGWVITALFALALFADHPELAEDPDKTWGVASRELLGPGLTGLMLACLLAALMSSVDAYMIVGSALVVRNIYAPFINPNASEREYVKIARITGALVVGGGVIVSLQYMDVFEQLQLTWIIPVLFAAAFWVGMYWRRATTAAAWGTLAFSALVFFILPLLMPVIAPGMRADQKLMDTNQIVRTVTTRVAAPSDVARRQASISLWDSYQQRIGEIVQQSETAQGDRQQQLHDERVQIESRLRRLGDRPSALVVGDAVVETQITGGKSVYWTGGVTVVDDQGQPLTVVPQPMGPPEQIDDATTREILTYPENTRMVGKGSYRLDFLVYRLLGIDLTQTTDATLATLELPTKIVAPFLVMIALSWLTPANTRAGLDRYYAKMKTPVDPDPIADQQQLERVYADPTLCPRKKLFPGTNLEFQRPDWIDLVGFVACFAACFAIIGLAIWVASIGL